MLERSYTNLTLDELESIGTVYEQAVQSSGELSPADIEQSLNNLDEKLRPHLLREFLQYSALHNKQLESELDVYLSRFADYREIFLEVFSEQVSRTSASSAGTAAETDDSCEKRFAASRKILDSFLTTSTYEGALGRLDNYDVLRIIGTGGTGIVLEAWDGRLSRKVAIKLLSPHLAENPRARDRFIQEARAVGAIKHSNVVGIHSVEDEHAPPLLVLEYIQGQSLAELLDQQVAISIDKVIAIAKDVTAGLSAAHAEGIVHRDLKPGNILIDEETGSAHISDFGLARAIDNPELTAPGEVLGTPRYMSPEQVEGRQVDHRSDFFSFGAVLYRMLTDQHPFPGNKPITLARQICDHAPPPPITHRQDIPKWLSDLTLHLLEKKEDARPDSAQKILNILHRTESLERQQFRNSPRRVAGFVAAISMLGILVIVTLPPLLQDKQPVIPANMATLTHPENEPETATQNSIDTKPLMPPLVEKLIAPDAVWSQSYRAVGMELRSGKQTCPMVSQDGQKLCFTVVNSDDQNGVYLASRHEAIQPWKLTTQITLPMEGIDHFDDVEMSTDQKSLLFAIVPETESAEFEEFDLGFSRIQPDGQWSSPERLTILNSYTYDSNPTQSADGRLLVYSSHRQPTVGIRDLWISRRDTNDTEWSPPTHGGAALNSVENDLSNQLLGEPPVLVFTRHDGSPRSVWLSWELPDQTWAEPVQMPTPFDELIEAIWIFDDGDSIAFQTARDGWDKSRIMLTHRVTPE